MEEYEENIKKLLNDYFSEYTRTRYLSKSDIENLTLWLVSSTYDHSTFPDPRLFDTNCFTPLIDKYDNSKESKGKISCIPLALMEKIVPNDLLDNEEYKYSNDLDKKIYLYNYMNSSENNIQTKSIKLYYNNLCHLRFIAKLKGLNIFPEYFFKPFLPRQGTYEGYEKLNTNYEIVNNNMIPAEDYTRIISLKDNESLEEIKKNDYKRYCRIIWKKLNCWLGLRDVSRICRRLSYYNEDIKYILFTKFKRICRVKRFKSMDEAIENMEDIKDAIHQYLERYKECRFFVIPILYDEHYTIFVLDRFYKNKGILYYFNSSGCNVENIEGGRVYSLSSSSNIKRMKIKEKYKTNYMVSNMYKIIKETESVGYYYTHSEKIEVPLNVESLIVNKFTCQRGNNECSMFIILFHYINTINPPVNIETMRKNYMSFEFIPDNIANRYRSVFFSTPDEFKNLNDYLNTIDVRKVDNSKYREFIGIFNEALSELRRIYNVYKKER